MDAFTIEIAELVTRVQPMFISTREYCRAYLTDKPPEFFVEVTEEDLIYEQRMLDEEAVEEGLRLRKFTDPFLERATIQRKIAYELLSRNTVLLHWSSIPVYRSLRHGKIHPHPSLAGGFRQPRGDGQRR